MGIDNSSGAALKALLHNQCSGSNKIFLISTFTNNVDRIWLLFRISFWEKNYI